MIGGVDVGGTKTAVGSVDSCGLVTARRECPTTAGRSPADAIGRIARMLREGAGETGATLEGIGSSGPVMRSADPFLSRIPEVISANCTFVPFEKTTVTLAQNPWNSGRGKTRTGRTLNRTIRCRQ